VDGCKVGSVHERNGRQEAGLSQQPVKGKNPCRAGAFLKNQNPLQERCAN